MAVATSLATNADPASVIFDQVDLRSHFCQCMPDSGELMICCNQCSDWFHEVCITDPIPSDIEQWKYIRKICQQKCLSPSETI